MVISSARSLGSLSRAMEYRRLGTGGTAFKTIDRYRSSLLHFNAFLETKGLGLFENLEEGEVCKVDLDGIFLVFAMFGNTFCNYLNLWQLQEEHLPGTLTVGVNVFMHA